MSKFKDSLKEELKDELEDIVYEKAKAEIKEKVKANYDSKLGAFLRFFGFNRSRKEAVDTAAEKIKENEEVHISETMFGILELFSINMTKSAIEMTTLVVSENPAKVRAKDFIEKIALDNIPKEENDEVTETNEETEDDNNE